ncbi:MAG: helix-turn-helix transcriptional regulator [Cyclobacteriaceae bacterium]|nr:helix-turn-helix transcriptional regulator [Cyclobacteriaceae bacterium]
MHDTLIPTEETTEAQDHAEISCSEQNQKILAARDVMEILSGKWKIQILAALMFKGNMRFMDLLRMVNGIGAKMLSKELHDLEANRLVKRTVLPTKPITVDYAITPYGKTLRSVINTIVSWGIKHRNTIMREEE